MLFSLYLRPWVLLTGHSTAHVPHIANLDLVVLRHKDDKLYPQVTVRRRLCVRTERYELCGIDKHPVKCNRHRNPIYL
jgi:hypothetical protein